MPRTKEANRELLLVGFGVCVMIAIVLLQLRDGSERAAAGGPSALKAAEDNGGGGSRVGRLPSDNQTPERNPRPRARARENATPAPAATPEHATVESKRQYRSDNFQDPNTSLNGYRLENLVRTADGMALAPADRSSSGSEEGEIRKGVLESPTIPLEFPSNYMMPLWRQKLPEGSGLTVEMAISPNGQDWSRWFALEPNGDEISPTYPDGTPNPNYGFIGGTGIANGTRLYPFARYRVTMTSGDVTDSPVLHEFRIYYVDSAGPDGVLAEKPYSGQGQGQPSGGQQ